MKTYRTLFTAFIISITLFSHVQAQDITSSLKAADAAYAAKESLVARENLQKALIDLNNLLGKEILALMPQSLGGLAVDLTQDNIIANSGFAGLLVTRTYGTDSNMKIDATLANNSPMLALVNASLGNSMMSGLIASQTGQKQITLSGYKGMFEKKDNEEGPVVYTINIPMNDSLFTFETTGFNNESEVITMAEQINLDQIGALVK